VLYRSPRYRDLQFYIARFEDAIWQWRDSVTIPRVITLASLKGGAGKSTAAAALAVYWYSQGKRPALIDADPQRSISSWRATKGALENLPVIADSGDHIARTIERAARVHRPVIVDTPGFRSPSTVDAIAASDLVLIPVKPSPFDAAVAFRTRALIDEIRAMGGRREREAAVRYFMAMTTPGTVIGRHIRNVLADGGFPLLDAEIGNRVAFPDSGVMGLTPTITEPSGRAAQEIAAIAEEIEQLSI
jgi:chromosome partitioning protein